MIESILEKIVGAFVNKKKVIGWISAVGLAIGALAASMSTQEFKDAVCAAPVIEVPHMPDPTPTPAVPVPHE